MGEVVGSNQARDDGHDSRDWDEEWRERMNEFLAPAPSDNHEALMQIALRNAQRINERLARSAAQRASASESRQSARVARNDARAPESRPNIIYMNQAMDDEAFFRATGIDLDDDEILLANPPYHASLQDLVSDHGSVQDLSSSNDDGMEQDLPQEAAED